MGARCGSRYRRHSEVNTPAGASGTPEQEKTMQYVYRCTRCNTGWLATKVEPSGQGWAAGTACMYDHASPMRQALSVRWVAVADQ